MIFLDIDECNVGRHTCPADATCVNTHGSYKCNCPSGYKLDETSNRCDGKVNFYFETIIFKIKSIDHYIDYIILLKILMNVLLAKFAHRTQIVEIRLVPLIATVNQDLLYNRIYFTRVLMMMSV